MLRITQKTAPATKPVTIDQVKTHIYVTHDDDDELLTAFLDAAIAYLDGMAGALGRCLISQTWTLAFNAWPATRFVPLPFPNVSAVTVSYFDADNVLQAVDASDYQLLEDEISALICFSNDFSTWPTLYSDREDRIQVDFTAGFADADTVPDPLCLAIKMLVARWYLNRGDTDVAAVPDGVKALISPYQRISL